MNREEWLNMVLDEMVPLFVSKGYKVPNNRRASVGFPYRSSKAIGQVFPSEASAASIHEVFVHPIISNGLDAAGILCHELGHVVVGLHNKHNRVFKDCVYAMGLTGKATATVPGEEFISWYNSKDFPAYPHDSLNYRNRGPKQDTNLIKVRCNDCGCIYRITKKWIFKTYEKNSFLSCASCKSENVKIDLEHINATNLSH